MDKEQTMTEVERMKIAKDMMLSVKAVVEQTGMPEYQVRRLINSGELKSYRFGNGRKNTIFVHPDDLDEFAAKQLRVYDPANDAG